MRWYFKVLEKYADFTGRARRREYWMFSIINGLIAFVLHGVDRLVGSYSVSMELGLLNTLYSLAVLIPCIAVLVRRLHDTGRSGWWAFIVLVPIIGIIVLFIFTVLDSDVGDNAYGVDPTRED